jgi:UrcA family protein
MNTLITLLATVAVAVSPVTPAVAQKAPGVKVVTRDLNLATAAGQRMLTLRITRAASQLCDITNERFGAKVRVAQRQCRDEAMATALASLPNAIRLAARTDR